MSKVNDLLFSRLKQKFSKMGELAEISSKGQLSSFAGVFRVTPLSAPEQESLEELLKLYQEGSTASLQQDLALLSNLTSEIKAISNQAAILHGERIKKAQTLLKNYRDGAFSAWLIATYGNRQTPYNFLHYYELYHSLPPHLITKLDEMPRQAVYTLASRDASIEKKREILEGYRGETKNEMLHLIRQTFPLKENDQRKEDSLAQALQLLQKLLHLFQQKKFKPKPSELQALKQLLGQLHQLL